MSNTARATLLLFVTFFLGTAPNIFAAEGDFVGWVVTDNGVGTERILDLAAQPDGKLIAAGHINQIAEPTLRTVIVRYGLGGGFDTSFGTGGKVFIPSVSPSKIVLQQDGKIVLVGTSGSDFYVARLNSNGSPDTTFNTTGVVILDLRGTNDAARTVKIQLDGKIVVGGTSDRPAPGPGNDFAIVRFNPDGSLDSTFDGDGKAITPISSEGSDPLVDLVIQTDGKIVVAGNSLTFDQNGSPLNLLFLVVRFNSDGSLDTTFDGDGKVFTQVGPSNAPVSSIALRCDGKIVVAGTATSASTGEQVGLVRYNTNGSVDASFGNGGIVITHHPSGPESTAGDMTIQADNKIVVGGKSGSPQGSLMTVARFNANGSIDSTFSDDGWNVLATPPSANSYAVVIMPNGRIVIGGTVFSGSESHYIYALFHTSSGPSNCFDKIADFDDDGRTDYSFFRNGLWVIRPSSNIDTFYAVEFGLSTDKLSPADFDGDGITDISVFRDGMWYLLRSTLGFTGIQFGTSGDIPLPADYDGDGRADLAVFRHGEWYVLGSQVGFYGFHFGVSVDRPVPADFDGDGKTDPAVYRDGNWFMLRSQLGFGVVPFGVATDRPVVGDYDGDGRADQAVFRFGTWYVLGSTQGFSTLQFGVSNDIPIPGDYDGDGRTDISVFRNGTWYMQRSQLGFGVATLGAAGDVPIPSVYVPWAQQMPW